MDLFNLIFGYYQKHFYIVVVFLFIIIALFQLKRGYKDNLFLLENSGFIILDGKFKAGKTRLMTNLQKDAKNHIIISNFWSGYSHIRFNSIDDIINLLLDVQEISEYQNYSVEEIKEYYKAEGKEIINLKLESNKKLSRFKFIPKDGYYTKFLWTCDEFQNLFFSRNSLSNFSGKNSKLLKLFHQARHLNSLFIFATQNADELDIKFRRLSTYYINTWDTLRDYFYGYNIFYFENNSIGRKIDEDEMTKVNKAPIIKINKYKLNNIIFKINEIFLRLKRKFNLKKLYKIKYRFDELEFNSKFNCDPDISIYKPGDLFIFLDKFYKEEQKKKSFDKLNFYV